MADLEKFDLLKNIIVHLDNFFANDANSKDLSSFVSWLGIELSDENCINEFFNENGFGNNDYKVQNSLANIDTGIGILNGLMHRYGRVYSKIALDYSSNLSIEEFTFLGTLISFEGKTKTELIEVMIFEKSTGIEIIKRLVNAGFVEEELNPLDKRSKILKVTSEGKKVLYSAFGRMNHVSREITNPLDNSEKKILHQILTKLEKYHRSNLSHNIERLKNNISK